VAEIFRRHGPAYRHSRAAALSRGQRRVMSAIERCRTAALGGHVERCDACGHQRIAYNSCRDRHCPKCQSLARAQWLEDRQAELLEVEYSLEPLRDKAAFAAYLAAAANTEWVVYAKAPFGGPAQVLRYLGRYTHRVAISNNRLLGLEDGRVSFLWKDYQHDGAKRVMNLAAEEFIRRFLLHVLPDGFQHIRSYGLLANRYREVKLARCRQLLGTPTPACEEPAEKLDYRERFEQLTGQSLRDCPVCGRGHMLCIETFPAGTLPRGASPDTS
jgi:hypothetical protein